MEAGFLPAGDDELAEGGCRTDLAADDHEDDVGTSLIVASRTDDDGRSSLGSRLVGKGKWDEDDIAELKTCRNRHRQDCPRPV